MSASSRRIAKAFFAAPLATPILYFLLTLPIGPLTAARLQIALYDIFTFGLMLSYIAAIVIGLPILCLLMHFRMTKLPLFATLGSLIGALVIYLLVGEMSGTAFALIRLLLIGAACGLASASIFWQLAFREQPAPEDAANPTGGHGSRSEAQPA